MLHTLPNKTKTSFSAFPEEMHGKETHSMTGKNNSRSKSHFSDLMDTCYELQSTVESIQRFIQLYPDCRTCDPDTQETVMKLMNDILDQKRKTLHNQISHMLEIHDRKNGQSVDKNDTTRGLEKKENLNTCVLLIALFSCFFFVL